MVHVVQQRPGLGECDVLKQDYYNPLLRSDDERWYLEEHDGVFARVLHEEVLEVGRAGRQHHLVALQRGSVHRQSYITECLNLRYKD